MHFNQIRIRQNQAPDVKGPRLKAKQNRRSQNVKPHVMVPKVYVVVMFDAVTSKVVRATDNVSSSFCFKNVNFLQFKGQT